ncbi:hypothetical protein GCM10011594_29630 [Nakamurella endophytica]|uniref:Uncharacterized protein n=2 Tax=Nakamurella endophytica TaxID=1748367 RepID=A0A917T1R9_9ACTN|nr:hypothetical protein GCM10011594_29630 [Nakamurella endophytica]
MVSRLFLLLLGRLADLTRRPPPRRPAGAADRGDVPGWVMITVMTAIVVIALLAVFKQQVLDAVTNAFRTVTGSGG